MFFRRFFVKESEKYSGKMGESMTEEELKAAFENLQAQIQDDQSNLNQVYRNMWIFLIVNRKMRLNFVVLILSDSSKKMSPD